MFAKFAEDGKNKDSKTETDKQVTLGSATFVSTKEMLRYFGDIDHMQKGRPCTFSREQFVTIDNYSLNRVINVNEGEQPKLLICNTLIQQSGRLLVRFASQLPSVPHLDVALHLIFYPFVVLVRSPNLSYFAYIQLCRKVRISIEHELTSFEIKMANHIRGQLRSFLNMDEIGIDSPSFVQSVL